MSLLTPEQLATLAEMLTYKRPHGTFTDNAFRLRYLADLPGIVEDEFQNLIVRVGESRVLWSSHTDTVHHTEGRQAVAINETDHTIALARRKRRKRQKGSNCLGADDTVGVFLMREMILAGVAGVYIFHYGEESGCLGSGDLARKTPETLTGVDFAVALDRSGYTDIVTSQLGGVCTSPEFVLSLQGALHTASHGALKYSGARGVYTDTAEYIDLVPECTNLSVGYFNQHSAHEYVDYAHVGELLAALINLDQSVLIARRDPHEVREVRREARVIEYVPSPLPLWHNERASAYEWDLWCTRCEAPLLDYHDPAYHTSDHCTCDEDEWQISEDLNYGEGALSEEDRKFLRYLKGLDS